MNPRRTLLFVHHDKSRLERFGGALAREFDALLASTTDAATRLISSRGVDMVVINGKEGLGYLDELDRLTPGSTRVLLFNGSGMGDLIRALEAGQLFIALPEPEEPSTLVRQLRSLAYPRAAEREVPEGPLGVRFGKSNEGGHSYSVLDLSRRGMAFALEPGQDPDRFRPGTRLETLSLWRGDQRLMTGVSAVVRHLAPFNAKGAATHRVGIEFQVTRSDEGEK